MMKSKKSIFGLGRNKKNLGKFHDMEKFNRVLGSNPDAGILNMEMLNMQSKNKGVKGKRGGGLARRKRK